VNLAQQIHARTGHNFPILSRFPWFSSRLAAPPAVGNGAAANGATVEEVVEAAAEAHEAMDAEEKTFWDENEAKQKEELANRLYPPTKPELMGGYTSWEGKRSEIWYYPKDELYGVVCIFNPSLNTGPRFEHLSEAQTYAVQATRV